LPQERSIWILVDYSNLHRLDSERGVAYLAPAFLERLGDGRLAGFDRARIRFYGGWYESDELTVLAQNVVREMAESFPSVVQTGEKKIKVTTEIARSLISSPEHDLLHTYRRRLFPGNIKSVESPFENCVNTESCAIGNVAAFVNDRRCPGEECGVRPKHIFIRPEQKLVDSMIVADVIALASRREACAVISSDDDVWPGIRTALDFGIEIFHLQSKPGQITPEAYLEGVGENYIPLAYPN